MNRKNEFASRGHLALLGRLTRIFHSSLNPKVILRLALVDAIRILGATSGSVVLINPETGLLEIEVSVGLSEQGKRLRLHPGEGITGWVALHGKPARVNDARKDPRYVPARRRIRSELAVPLERNPQKSTAEEHAKVIGILNVDSVRVSAFDEADEELLRTLASQISSLIQNAWLYEQATQRAAQLDTLLKLDQTIMATETLPDVLQQVAQGACRLTGARFCSVLLLNPEETHLDWRATSGKFNPLLSQFSLPLDDNPLGVTVRRRRIVVIEDVRKSDPLLHAILARLRKPCSLLGVPLLIGEKSLGALVVHTDRPHRFSNEETQILSALANHAALAIQRCHLSARLLSSEEELRQSERLSAIGLLAAEVAHEIRNPLTVIKMLTHNLERELPPGDSRRKDFEVLARKMDQMNRTVERVLGLARSSEPTFECHSLNAILEDLALLIRHKLAQHQLELKLSLGKEIPTARIDRAQIEQALLNLVLNAFHAMPQGGCLELKTGSLPRQERIWVEVRDSGVGMSAAQKENLFRPFLTSRAGGTGLGMAIVSKIVKAHGGEISVRSRMRRGASIRLTLPSSVGNAEYQKTEGS